MTNEILTQIIKMKKAYKSKTGRFYVVNDNILIEIYPLIDLVQSYRFIDFEKDMISNCTECYLPEAVAAFDKVVKSLKDKMI
jgi:hypothetical protein